MTQASQQFAVRHLFAPLVSYPVPTTSGAIERIATIAERLGAHVSAYAFEMDVQLPPGVYADMYSLGEVVAAEYQRGVDNARRLIAEFQSVARRRELSHEASLEQCVPADVADKTVELAHVSDLIVVPVKKDAGGQRDVMEALLFGAGRPMLFFPEAASDDLPDRFSQVAIAWDNKGPAARAVADALPLLRDAASVRLITVDNEGKADAGRDSALARSVDALRRHLSRHGVSVVHDRIDARGATAGELLQDHVLKAGIDLLVMGGYGHARLKEMILGGATDSILREPPGYVFMSR